MAIIQLKSSNPEFSFVIRKNPASGMLLRAIRQGMGHGWFSAENTYNVYFKDADNEVSYKKSQDEQFEYLNTTRYTSPLAILNMVDEFFRETIKKRFEEDKDGFTHELHVLLVNIPHERYIRFFQNNFTDFRLEATQKASKSFTVTISTEKSMQELLSYTSLFFLFMSIFAEEYVDLSNDLIVKYIGIINSLDAPFYIRYLFGRNVLNDRGRFNKHKVGLEATKRNVIDLKFGNTAIQRRDKIKSLIDFDKAILDVGCGEGFYAMPFARNLKDAFYYAIDVNEELIEMVNGKAKKADLENLITYNSIQSFLEAYSGEQVDIILTEVVEHMQLEESEVLLKDIMQNIDFEKLIITTPNAEFNTFYALDGFRHDDHKWEATTKEFQAWIEKICGEQFGFEFFQIGDVVDGISTTQGVLITKLEECECGSGELTDHLGCCSQCFDEIED